MVASTTFLGLTSLLVSITLGLGIASLVLNIVILNKVDDITNPSTGNGTTQTPASATTTTTTTTITTAPINPSRPTCKSNINANFKKAGEFLLQGLDESVDPCEDFYKFTCNKYLEAHQKDLEDVPRFGTYDEGQTAINVFIYGQLNNDSYTRTEKAVKTVAITKTAAIKCATENYEDHTLVAKSLYDDLTSWFTAVPLVDANYEDVAPKEFFDGVGQLELKHALGTLLSTLVTVDYKQIKRHAMYIGQPILSMPRDFYVKPQFLSKVLERVDDVEQSLKTFAEALNKPASDTCKTAQEVVNFEIAIAMASWPDDLLRNYEQQYNQYNLSQVDDTYKQISIEGYARALLSQNGQKDVEMNSLVLTMPSYISWLDSVFDSSGSLFSQKLIVNYITVQLIQEYEDFLSGTGTRKYVRYSQRRGRGLRKIGAIREVRKSTSPADNCIDILSTLMPYGTGWVYTRTMPGRSDVVEDVTQQTHFVIDSFKAMVKTLHWMTPDSRTKAFSKAENLKKNVGWPTDLFGDNVDKFQDVEDYHSDYKDILVGSKSWFEMLVILNTAMENREFFKLMSMTKTQTFDPRSNFLASPATVNAWYQPERNSITFPLAVFHTPYYDLSFPQAFRYGGQGGTGGHELTHGYDDEGVQFGPTGALEPCDTFHCGWMDANSTQGFIDMAQCVVSQFNTECCPVKTGNVHCANGATTQGENIADLGGQQAAWRAYREYVRSELNDQEEGCVPGMETYTPNQIFWVTYGYSWCMAQRPDNLVNQILTNPHAPAQCRTNNVMQDIPEFGIDWGCKRGSLMYPQRTDSCKVWVGE